MVPSFLLIDKPAGITSHDAVQRIRVLTKEKRIGHTGTLDPFATGLLIILLGPATRLAQYLHALPKTYEAKLTLGAVSTTDDLTGAITPVASAPIPAREEIQTVLQKFKGKQQQVPPIYSAIKTKGRKLYDLARSGATEEAEKTAGERVRRIEIFSLELLEYEYPALSIRVQCSSGTYVRALGRDIAAALHTGAYLSALCRTAIGNFLNSDAENLPELTNETVLSHTQPIEKLLAFMPRVAFSTDNVAKLKQGRALSGEWDVPAEQPLALADEAGGVFGIGRYAASEHTISPATIFNSE